MILNSDERLMKSTRRTLYPWLCLTAVFGSQIASVVVIVIFLDLFPRFNYWVSSPFGTFFLTAGGGIAAFLVVVAFARPKSLADFLKIFELDSFREICLYALGAGVLLGLAGVLLTSLGGVEIGETRHIKTFTHQAGPEKHLLSVLLLVGPLFEEITVRGFLYRAFRDRYGVAFSVVTVSIFVMITHIEAVTMSMRILFMLVVLQVTLCLFMEKTRNLWNCVLCHVSYNGILICWWLIGTRG